MQALRKAEAAELVQQLGITFSPAYTADELKALIKAHLFPEGKSSTQQALKGLSSMNKKELQANASASSQAEPETKEVLQQVVGALGQINQRLNALEQEKASTTPSTDFQMVQEPDGATSVSRQ